MSGQPHSRHALEVAAGRRSQILDAVVARTLLEISPDDRNRSGHLASEIRRIAEEISERFDSRIYRAAMASGSWLANLLAHAAAGGVPWWPVGLADRLPELMHVHGEIEALEELQRRGTLLIVPTHQTVQDGIFHGHLLQRLGLPPAAWAVGSNLFRDPVSRALFPRLGAYAVDRQRYGARYHRTLLNYCAQLIEAGVHTLFFPAGGRVRSGAIETRLKSGLLRAGLRASRNMRDRSAARPNVFVVPVSVSYDAVLEAPSLIDQYLASIGVEPRPRPRSAPWRDVAALYWRAFGREEIASVHVGAALHISGEPAQEPSPSLPRTADEERAAIRATSEALISTYYRDHRVLPSQLAAFALFESLRGQKPGIGLAECLALPADRQRIPVADFRSASVTVAGQIAELNARGSLRSSRSLTRRPAIESAEDGLRRLALHHHAGWLRIDDSHITVTDPALLYYYRNRLSGYGLSLRSGFSMPPGRGTLDEEGFLA